MPAIPLGVIIFDPVLNEKPKSELKRLNAEQVKTRHDEVFGGLTPAEQAAYDAKAKRINQLEIQLAAIVLAKKSEKQAKANQATKWNKAPETDTPQSEAHQPYRGRENDAANSSKDSTKRPRKAKGRSERKSGE